MEFSLHDVTAPSFSSSDYFTWGVGRGEAPLAGVVGENLQGLWEAAFF